MQIKCELENIVQNFDGTITYYFKDKETNFRLLNGNMQRVKELAEKSKEKGLKLELSKWCEQRSLDANAYFHVLVDKISKVLKKGFNEVKKSLNLDYGTIKKDEQGKSVGFKLPASVDVDEIYPYAKWFDNKTENGTEFNFYILYKPTHELDTKEMSRLIDGVVHEAQNLEIETKTPEQIADMLSLWGQKK